VIYSVQIRAALFIYILSILSFGACCAQRNVEVRVSPEWDFALQSWKSANERWNFSLCSIKHAERKPRKDVQEHFNSVGALEHRLAQLSPGARINWSSRSEIGFAYPPSEVVRDLKRFAKEHQIRLSFEPVPLE
jgi:hypothetical protein